MYESAACFSQKLHHDASDILTVYAYWQRKEQQFNVHSGACVTYDNLVQKIETDGTICLICLFFYIRSHLHMYNDFLTISVVWNQVPQTAMAGSQLQAQQRNLPDLSDGEKTTNNR